MTDTTKAQAPPIEVFGGPTALIEYGGLRFLTDPTFDEPGEYDSEPPLVKTASSAVTAASLGAIDVVLLSHDEHADNLDTSGREFLGDVPLTLTTQSGAERIGGTARGLAPWTSIELDRPGGGTVTVTATRAQHGPDGCEPFLGDVIGFVLAADGLPTVYISGDNASLDVVQEVADRFDAVDTAVLFAGAVRIPVIFDGALLTLDGARAAEAARILDVKHVVAAHVDSWAHFTEGRDEFVAAFEAAGIADRLVR